MGIRRRCICRCMSVNSRVISFDWRRYALYTEITNCERVTKMDDDWVELINEAKSLGLTVEDVRDWLAEMNTEDEDVR
jgi:hypothetical protein